MLLYINLFQQCYIVAMKSHKAAYDAWKVECLVIFVVIIYPVTGIYTLTVLSEVDKMSLIDNN